MDGVSNIMLISCEIILKIEVVEVGLLLLLFRGAGWLYDMIQLFCYIAYIFSFPLEVLVLSLIH